jgi:hypothetical protein
MPAHGKTQRRDQDQDRDREQQRVREKAYSPKMCKGWDKGFVAETTYVLPELHHWR